MKVDFDNMRVQMVSSFNRIIAGLNAHIDDGALRMNDAELEVLDSRINDLRSGLVCLAYMSGENETFGEVGHDGMRFLSLQTKQDGEYAN